MNKHTSEPMLYVDISQYLEKRLNTGIQRVVKEFLLRAMNDSYKLHVIYYNPELNGYYLVDPVELSSLFSKTKDFILKKCISIDLFSYTSTQKLFLEIDSVWNEKVKRDKLYPKLKLYNYKIINFIYDLIPVIYPDYMYAQTKKNFPQYLKAVYQYSDCILFDSFSSQKDFFKIKPSGIFMNYQTTRVIHLGADFTNESIKTSKYQNILNSKYLLFVGTIEPRKEQMLLLQAYEELHNQYPDLHLVYIGRIGWNVDEFMTRLHMNKLKDSNIHHFENIEDSELTHFYNNAFLTLYLSKYEGYGLPIAEALFYHNVIITSNNSSLREAGGDFAVYLKNNTKLELLELLREYLQDQKLHNKTKELIVKNYKPNTWNLFYRNLLKAINE